MTTWNFSKRPRAPRTQFFISVRGESYDIVHQRAAQQNVSLRVFADRLITRMLDAEGAADAEGTRG